MNELEKKLTSKLQQMNKTLFEIKDILILYNSRKGIANRRALTAYEGYHKEIRDAIGGLYKLVKELK